MTSEEKGIDMKYLRLGLLHLTTVALLFVAAVPAFAERLLRASDAGLHGQDSTPAEDGQQTETLRLVTPDGQVLDLALEVQSRLMQDARADVPGVRDGTTRIYAGEVSGRAGSWLRLTRIDGAWLGAVHDGEQLWFLDPASHHRELA